MKKSLIIIVTVLLVPVFAPGIAIAESVTGVIRGNYYIVGKEEVKSYNPLDPEKFNPEEVKISASKPINKEIANKDIGNFSHKRIWSSDGDIKKSPECAPHKDFKKCIPLKKMREALYTHIKTRAANAGSNFVHVKMIMIKIETDWGTEYSFIHQIYQDKE